MSFEKCNKTTCPALPGEVFLDTSIHLARFKARKLHDRIQETVSKFRWVGTASYTKLEFGNVLLSSAAYFCQKLEELGSLEDLQYFINNRLPSPYHNKYKMWFFNLLSQHFNHSEATERAKRALRHFIRIGTDIVSAQVDTVHDQIKCPWTNQTGRRWKQPTRCEARKPGCRLPQFFIDNKGVFQSIQICINSIGQEDLTDQLRDFADIIQNAFANPEYLRRYSVCKGLADAIIAVEGSSYKGFFTQNIAESQYLCHVLNQLLLYLPQKLENKLEYYDYRPK